MDLLITLFIITAGFMVFGSLFFVIGKALAKRKHNISDLQSHAHRKNFSLRINKTHNIYSFR